MYKIVISGTDKASIILIYGATIIAEEKYQHWVDTVRCPGKCHGMTVTLFDEDDCPIKSYTPSFGEDHQAMRAAWIRGFNRGINLNRKFPIKLEVEKIKDLREIAAESMYCTGSITGKLEHATLNGYYAGLLSERR